MYEYPPRIARVILVALAALTFSALPTMAQGTGVDPSFNAVVSARLQTALGMGHAIQSDGKVVVFGQKSVVNGVAKGNVFRLNSDGSLDTTFDYCACGLSAVTGLKLTPDGKIIVSGSERTGTVNGKMIRLNSDGSIDPGYLTVLTGPSPLIGSAELTVEAVTNAGRVYATSRYSYSGNISISLHRLNADGSPDATFSNIGVASGSPVAALVRVKVLADGRFYMSVSAGNMSVNSTLRRYNSNGSVDSTFEAPTFASSGFPSQTSIRDIEVEPNTDVLVAGSWATVNGVAKSNLVRIHSAGNVDVNFPNVGPNVQYGAGIERLPDGKILFAGNTDIATSVKMFRLNPDGSVDNTYQMETSVLNIQSTFDVDPMQRSILWANTTTGYELVRLLPEGARDLTFRPLIGKFGRVVNAAVQSDGKVLIQGEFTLVGTIERAGFARVNADGSVDPTFSPGTGFGTQSPSQLLIQPDGKIIAAGPFAAYNGVPSTNIVRVNGDGSRDASFNPVVTGSIYSAAIESDGQIVIAGNLTAVDGTPRTKIARLNPNGSLDTTFNPTVGGSEIRSVFVEADGRIVIGGTYSGVNGFNRVNLSRLNADGTLDQTFNAVSIPAVKRLVLQSGKYIITTGTTGFVLDRRNADGSDDTSFNPPAFSVSGGDAYIDAIVILPDNSILVGGAFETVGGRTRRNLARLAPNGALDELFAQNAADNRVRALALTGAGSVIAGGDFTNIFGSTRTGVARIFVAAYAAKTPYDFNGDGRADFTVFRPSTNTWYELFAGGTAFASPAFGVAGDIPVPADFDGDGITDEAIFRPSNGAWWFFSSANGAYLTTQQGQAGDVPMPSDLNGDGKADFVVYRPSNNSWYRALSGSGQQSPFIFGAAGDKPIQGDFDGDGKGDIAIFRPSTGEWWYAASASGNAFRVVRWGQNGDIPVPADFDGDGKTDFAVFRPSEGGWYVNKSGGGSPITMAWGVSEDRPVPADYDGDGKADIAVFRPSSGVWYLFQTTGGMAGVQWGVSSDIAIPNAVDP